MLPNPFNTSPVRDTMKSVHIYPVIAKGYGVFIQPEKGYFFSYKENKKESTRLEILNVQACAILEQCTGSNTVKDIVDILTDQFEDTPPDLLLQVTSFLDETAEKGYLVFSDHPEAQHGIIQGSITYSSPFRVLMEVTTKCNLACGHCLLSAGQQHSDELTASQFLTILERLFNMGVKQVTLSGGEILVKEGWGTLVDFCTERFQCTLLTNGVLITEEIANKLSSCQEIHASLYGTNPEMYEHVSGVKGSYKRALKGIRMLTERNANVGLSTPITPLNLSQVEDLVTLAISLKCRKARVGTVIPIGRAENDEWELTPLQKVNLDIKVKELQEKYEDKIGVEWGDDVEKGHSCGAGYYRWTITANGDVYPCVLFRTPIGNVLDEDPVKICTSPVVEFLKTIEVPHRELCGECPLLYTCESCHGQAYAHYQAVDHCLWADQFREAPEPLRSVFFEKDVKK
jgi:radical SAM protein with 4Fe4S-binding SPASM domain